MTGWLRKKLEEAEAEERKAAVEIVEAWEKDEAEYKVEREKQRKWQAEKNRWDKKDGKE
jgi:hypothetical protein